MSSKKDFELYQAIRHLSILKEQPNSNPKEVEEATKLVEDRQKNLGEPSEMALLRGSGDVRQPGVVARQLPPTEPRAKEKLTDQVASREGRCGRLEPYAPKGAYTVLRGREGRNTLLLPDRSDFLP